jgi:hypothetical protein
MEIILFMKVVYILVFTVAIALLFVNLNRLNMINTKFTIGFWLFFLVFITLHSGIIQIDFLTSFKKFKYYCLPLLFVILVHFLHSYDLKRIRKSTFLSEGVKQVQIGFSKFLVQKVLYVFAWIFTIIIILSDS